MGHSKKPLDARLRAAADMALETLRGVEHPHAADIGCDHGFVTAYLLRQRPELSMIAGDISEASLAKARILLSQAGLESQVQTICGDGLSVLDGQPQMDVILIAGMGGRTILEILRQIYRLGRAYSAGEYGGSRSARGPEQSWNRPEAGGVPGGRRTAVRRDAGGLELAGMFGPGRVFAGHGGQWH